MSAELAYLGGSPVIPTQFPRYTPIGGEEIGAVTAVMETGVLSKFIGGWNDDFYGGEKVREFVDNDVFEALACPPSPAAWLRRKAR